MTPLRIAFAFAGLLLFTTGSGFFADAPSLAGSWQGTIKVAGQELPVVFEIKDAGRDQWTGNLLSSLLKKPFSVNLDE